MAKRTNSLAGTITKGSMKYVTYMAMMDLKSDQFTCQEIYDMIKERRPDIKKQVVQTHISTDFVKMRIVKKTDRLRELPDSARKNVVYERNPMATQPIIREKGIGPAKPRTKPQPKKVNESAAPILSAVELGETIIDFIKHLQENLANTLVSLDESQKALRQEKKAHQVTKDSMQYKVNGLEQANKALEKQLRDKVGGRTFNTESVLEFKKRQHQGANVGGS